MKQYLVLAIVLMTSLVSCTRKQEPTNGEHLAGGDHGTPTNWKFRLPQGDAARGRKVFVDLECYKCHEVKGESFPALAKEKGDVGPELSQMAGMHPLEFFGESIINPNAVIDPKGKELGYLAEDGKSKMPDYSDVLTVKQVSDLAAYLASLKGQWSHAVH